FRVRSKLPGRRARSAGCVAELLHRFGPFERSTARDDWLLPVLPLPISTGVDELLELAVRDFESIDPEVWHRDGFIRAFELQFAARDERHARRNAAGRRQLEFERRLVRRGFERLVAMH